MRRADDADRESHEEQTLAYAAKAGVVRGGDILNAALHVRVGAQPGCFKSARRLRRRASAAVVKASAGKESRDSFFCMRLVRAAAHDRINICAGTVHGRKQ